jgi:hypothetical protein
MSTVKQVNALKRGSDIRVIRGAIVNMENVLTRYDEAAGHLNLKAAIYFLKAFHYKQFGFAKCRNCGKELKEKYLSTLCEECLNKS